MATKRRRVSRGRRRTPFHLEDFTWGLIIDPPRKGLEEAWPDFRRAVWLNEAVGDVPLAASDFDGLTASGRRTLYHAGSRLAMGNHRWKPGHGSLVCQVDGCWCVDVVEEVRAELDTDRLNLQRFKSTSGARALADVLEIFEGQLDSMQRVVDSLPGASFDAVQKLTLAAAERSTTYARSLGLDISEPETEQESAT